MRKSFQAAVAGLVVAISATVAWAIKDSTANLGAATRANVTHQWNSQGEGKGKAQFGVDFGSASFLEPNWVAYAGLTRARPADGSGALTTYLNAWIPFIRATQTVYRGGANTKRMDSMEESLYLAQTATMISQLIAAQSLAETRSYHPILGNVTVTWTSALVNARVYKEFTEYNLDASWRYQGRIAGGEQDGRKIVGTIQLKVRGADRLFVMPEPIPATSGR
jgi:hypothetical protein